MDIGLTNQLLQLAAYGVVALIALVGAIGLGGACWIEANHELVHATIKDAEESEA